MKDLFHGGEFHNMDLFLYMMHKSRLLKSLKLEDGLNRFLRRKKGLQFKKSDDVEIISENASENQEVEE